MRPIRGLAYLIVLGLAGAMLGCGGSGDGNHTPAPTPSTQGTIMGRVFNQADAALDSVTVILRAPGATSGGATTQTNADGYFTFGAVEAGEYIVRAFREGYVENLQRLTATGGQINRLVLNLASAGVVEAIDPTVDNTVAHRGGSVMLPANSLVTPSGRQVNSATVTLTTSLPSDDNYTLTFPSGFTGIPSSPARQAEQVTLYSYGYIDTVITDGAGNPLELATGRTATMIWPIDPATDPGTPTVPLWYVDPAIGRWLEEGVATRVSDTHYTAEVSHFTPWNLDVAAERSTLIVRVLVNGTPEPNVEVRIRGSNWASGGRTAGAGGSFSVWIPVPAGATGDVLVLDSSNRWQEVRTGEQMPAVSQTRSLDIALDDETIGAKAFVTTLTWGEHPRDLDSHMTGPAPSGTSGRFHVYYGARGSLSAAPWCWLDTDDVTSYGPEVTTVRRALQGTYRFSVHHYAGSRDIENSGATVTLVTRDGELRTYRPPANMPVGTRYWTVYEVDVDASGNLTAIRDLNRYGADQSSLMATTGRAIVLPAK